MMTIRNLRAWAVAGLVVLNGCLPSLNAVYRDEDLVFDPALVGSWVQSENNWEFSKRDDKSYRLVYTHKDGQKGTFVAHLAEIRGSRFLDLFPEEIEMDVSAFYKFHRIPIHTIYLVRQVGEAVHLAAIDYQWLEEFLATHPNAIGHARFDGRTIITASTEDVQAFVASHQAKFSGKFDLTRSVSSVN